MICPRKGIPSDSTSSENALERGFALFALDACCCDHAVPKRELACDHLAEGFRRVDLDLGAERVEPFASGGIVQGLTERGV